MRKFLIAAALAAAVAANAFALNEQNTAFGKGPAQYLMTKEEAAQWKSIRDDAAAQAFIDLFWAKRDPSPNTPENEFRAEFDARVQYTDEKFSTKKKTGSQTDRGRVFIVFGPPARIARTNTQNAPQMGGIAGDFNNEVQGQGQSWVYEGEKAGEMFGTGRVEIKFTDQYGAGDYTLDAINYNVRGAEARYIPKLIKSPGLTVAPTYAAAAPAVRPAAPAAATPAPAPVAAAPAVLTEFRTADFATAVDELKNAKTNPYDKKLFVSYAESVTPAGEYFIPVSLYVPKSAGVNASSNLTFFAAVDDASGKRVAVYEEPAKLTASKEDFYFDKSITLPAGKHRAVFGLAENGKPVAMTATDLEVSGTLDPKAPGVSRLMISNNIYPLTEAQAPTDPFSFGGVKVVPKADRTFTPADELWYFIAVRNPGLDAANQPKFQAKVDLEGTDETGKKVKMSAPPSEVPVTEFKGMPGQYGIGSAIPLETFKPGDYTLTIKLMDTVSKTSQTVKESFKIVK